MVPEITFTHLKLYQIIQVIAHYKNTVYTLVQFHLIKKQIWNRNENFYSKFKIITVYSLLELSNEN